MDMLYHQYHHSQASTTPNATTIWGNDSLNRTNINMLQPMPLDVFQNIQLMTGSAGAQIGTDHQDVPQEFRAIMNASRRAAISSMMTLQGSALMPEGNRCFGEQPSPDSRLYSAPDCQSFKETHTKLTTPMTEGNRCFGEQPSPDSRWYSAPECQSFKETHTELTTPVTEGIRCLGEQPRPNNRWYSAPDCQSFKETHTELTTPVTEGIRCLGEQPWPNNMWYSAPEYQSSYELDRSRATYDIQELDVADSNILGMWRSSKVQETDEI
jgi:hypothetical protein